MWRIPRPFSATWAYDVDRVLDLVAKYVPSRLISTHVRYFLEDVLEELNP